MKVYRIYLSNFTYFYVITNSKKKLKFPKIYASKIVNYNEFQNDMQWLECQTQCN